MSSPVENIIRKHAEIRAPSGCNSEAMTTLAASSMPPSYLTRQGFQTSASPKSQRAKLDFSTTLHTTPLGACHPVIYYPGSRAMTYSRERRYGGPAEVRREQAATVRLPYRDPTLNGVSSEMGGTNRNKQEMRSPPRANVITDQYGASHPVASYITKPAPPQRQRHCKNKSGASPAARRRRPQVSSQSTDSDAQESSSDNGQVHSTDDAESQWTAVPEDTLEAKTKALEKEMQELNACIGKVSRNLAEEDTFQSELEQVVGRLHDESRICQKAEKRRLQETGNAAWHRASGSPSRNKGGFGNKSLSPPDYQAVSMEEVMKVNKELLMLLEEERLGKIELRSQYEKQLAYLRSWAKESRTEERRKVLKEFDYVIRKYHALAEDAASLARRERERVKFEKLRVQRIAENACKGFEKDIKERTKCALEEYRKLAQEAHDAAKREREELVRYCAKLESAVDRERRTFESHVVREAEKRIAGYRSACDSAQEQIALERQQYQELMDSVCDTVASRCEEFEVMLQGKCLQVLWDNGVDIEEADFVNSLQKVAPASLRSRIPKLACEATKTQVSWNRAMMTADTAVIPTRVIEKMEDSPQAIRKPE